MGQNHGLGFEKFTGTIQELTNEVKTLPKLDDRKLLLLKSLNHLTKASIETPQKG
jgi:hypothetical protein